MLCALAMYLTLQGELAGQESGLGLMRDLLPAPLFEFLAPRGTEWDAPLQGEPFAQPPVPGPEVVDLRTGPPGEAAPAPVDVPVAWSDPRGPHDAGIAYGSNNWAVAGTHTADGGALLANDMHLGLSVPNTWYRASLVFPAASPAAGSAASEPRDEERRVTGVMLPGAPFIVVGCNGHVAWGFTNSQGDWADLVVLDPVPGDPEAYRTPEGPRRLERAPETIHVEGGTDETLEVLSTVWGPVVDKDHRGRRRALAWVALREGGLNAALVSMEAASDLAAAQDLAARVGIPAQNFVVADRSGVPRISFRRMWSYSPPPMPVSIPSLFPALSAPNGVRVVFSFSASWGETAARLACAANARQQHTATINGYALLGNINVLPI